MKRSYLYGILCFAGLAACVLSLSNCKKDKPDDTVTPPATYTCTSNLTDGCMDDWKLVENINGNYIDPMQGFLQTLNELVSVPPEAGGPGPVTVDTVTDCMQGKYAARLTSKNFHLMENVDVFIPGYIGASVLDIPKATIHLGKPYTQKPVKLQGYYKYSPVSTDSAMIQILLTKWNSAASKRDTISYDKVIIKNAVPTYTPIDLTLTYKDATATPDTLVLIFASSAGVDFNDLQGCAGQIGSVMWVDDLKFQMP
jgi:hypothetical protein